MITRALLAAALSIPAVAGDLVSHAKRGNRVLLQTTDGVADLTWVSPSTFRFRYAWSATLPGIQSATEVEFRVVEEPAALLLATEELRVRILRQGVMLVVTDDSGKPLLTETAPVRREGSEIILEREAPPGVRYYGLGPRTQQSLDARGEEIRTSRPFLINTAGYGEYYISQGRFTFDLAKSLRDRQRVILSGAGPLDYYVFYGPGSKDILEEHMQVAGAIPALSLSQLRSVRRESLPGGSWLPPPAKDLSDYIRTIVHASFSGVLLPVFDVSLFKGTDKERAAQLGAIAPLVLNGHRNTRFLPYLLTYADEARLRGYPVIRPVPMQYPHDPHAHRYADQFMLGDEILVVPHFRDAPTRTLYLPMGTWTDLGSGQKYPGRREVTVPVSGSHPLLFIKNGAILPLAQADNVMHLHYFPRLAAEFFIFEPVPADYTQVHAAPAADEMRLEIESKVSRRYEWVVHDLSKPTRIIDGERVYEELSEPQALREGTWRWEAEGRKLRIGTYAGQDSDQIINIVF